MRILHVVSNVGCQSGVMKVVMTYFKEIVSSSDYTFDFLYWDDTPSKNYKNDIESLGGRLFLVDRPKLINNKSWKDFFELEGDNYEIIHLHMCFLNVFIKHLMSNNTKLICHAHTDKFSDKRLNSLRNKLLCLPINFTSNVQLACSNGAGINYFGKRFVETGSIVLNALNIDDYNISDGKKMKINTELGLSKDDIVYIHIGGFRKQKNHSFLLDVFYNVKKKQKQAKLLLVGDGPLRSQIISQVKQLGLENDVLFLGIREDVPSLLSVADYCVFPSIFEGLGIVLIEAQLSNLITYCSNTVPDEAFVTNNIYPLDLNCSPSNWADFILSTSNEKNKSDYYRYRLADYDIKNAVKNLQTIYDEVKD